VDSKRLRPETLAELEKLEWPGNVRQLQNTARWLTVMASSDEVHIEDLPPELSRQEGGEQSGGDWRNALKTWARRQLQTGRQNLLDEATPAFETIMIETALEQTGGRRQDAAKLLGWGRNTLSRKIKELHLGMEQGGDGVHT
jgi:two-component system nitrogen regulation response regulator GlnG